MDELMSTAEVARLFRLERQAARRYMRANGVEPVERDGKGLWWCRADAEMLAEHLKENRRRFITTGEIAEVVDMTTLRTRNLLERAGFERYEVVEEIGARGRQHHCWDREEVAAWMEGHRPVDGDTVEDVQRRWSLYTSIAPTPSESSPLYAHTLTGAPMTTAKAAELLRVSARRAYDLLHEAGFTPSRSRRGRSLTWRTVDVYALVELRRRDNQPATGWLDRHEAAELIGCSVRTIERWLDSGRATYIRQGGRKRFHWRVEYVQERAQAYREKYARRYP
jgi:excisionase family DNA binding protein